ncbi:MAG: transporter substrate-binding domain-containing protein [Coriobacteriia bacterium]|nr:transporter substrate-binding domain-containing protein [Coriobacteriia bacterium]
MKKRLVAAILTALVACLAFALCACTEPYNPDASKKEPAVDASALKAEGVLHVGVNAQSYPLAGQANGRMSGLEVDVASAIAQELGLEVEFVDIEDNGVKALEGDEVDMVMGIEAKDAKGKCWTSEGYAPSAISLFSTDEKAGVPEKGDGAKVSAATSSLSAWLITRQLGEDALQAEDDVKLVFQKLVDGEVQYAATDAVVGKYVLNKEGFDAHLVGVMQVPDQYCIGIAEGNDVLQEAVASAMAKVEGNGNGLMNIILTKWLGGPLDLSDVPQTAGAKTA